MWHARVKSLVLRWIAISFGQLKARKYKSQKGLYEVQSNYYKKINLKSTFDSSNKSEKQMDTILVKEICLFASKKDCFRLRLLTH